MSRIREKLFKMWLGLAARNRRVLVLDILLLSLAVYIGYALRLTLLITNTFRNDLLKALVLYPLCIVAALIFGGIYRLHWPQASVEEYARLAKWYACGSVLFICLNLATGILSIPRSSLALTLFAGLMFIGTARASWRLLELTLSYRNNPSGPRKKTIIIGAGEAGAYIARDLQRRHSELLPLGFVDEDPMKKGKVIAGLPVLGDYENLYEIASEKGVKVALIAIPSASGANLRKYLDALSSLDVEVRVLPSLHELAGGRIELASMRSVELRDLLRREPIKLDEEGIGLVISGKKVLVTGAGGSIGSEICAQVMRHSPAELIVLGHGEQSIYNLMNAFKERGAAEIYRPIIADIADEPTMRRIISEHRPEIVFHAAAHKHVPLMEENPREALRVNSLGTWTIADLAGSCGAERFVMISSDKAVNPTSAMGATKRLAERLLRTAQEAHPATKYMTVRFGNVLGSSGSVVPLFERQIRSGGPVTVTHRDMKRYFMLIPEAVSLVLQAASMGGGGELYVLDMGEPVNIIDMAETLIRLHGREPYSDIEIRFTGIRPGEKLYEELFYDPDRISLTMHDKIFLSSLDEEETPLLDDAKRLLCDMRSDKELIADIIALSTAR